MKHISLYEHFDFKDNNNFQAWFSGSKIVNTDGSPKVVYHGTNSEKFSVFDMSRTTNNVSKFGFWFSDDKDFSEMFGFNTMSVYLSVKNPHYITQEKWNEIRGKFAKNTGWFDSWRNELIGKGHDGLVVRESFENVGSFSVRNAQIIAVFNSNQIKSVDNAGDFNNDSDNIMESFSEESNLSHKDYIILYHSTDSDHFTESNPVLAAKGEQYFNPLGEGIYFSTNKQFTRSFGKNLFCYLLPKKSNIKVITQKKWQTEYQTIMKGVIRKLGLKYDNLTLTQKVELNRIGKDAPITCLNELEDYLEMEFDIEYPQRAIANFVTARNAKYDAVWYRDTDYYLSADEIVIPHNKFNPEYFKRIN